MDAYQYANLWNNRNKVFRYIMLSVFGRVLRGKPLSIMKCNRFMNEFMMTKTLTNTDVVMYVRMLLGREHPSYLTPPISYAKRRGRSRVDDIRSFLNPTMSRYLDMGSMDGMITMSVCSYLSWLRKSMSPRCNEDVGVYCIGADCNTYDIQDTTGVIITEPCLSSFEYTSEIPYVISKSEQPNTNSLNFMLYDGISLPFADESFDLITSFMTLHHVSEITTHITEIYRLLSTNGRWIVREHNVSSPEVGHTVNFLHECYDPDFNVNMSIHQYLSRDGWVNMCTSIGFKCVFVTPGKNCVSKCGSHDRDRSKRNVKNPFHSFYMVFSKG